MPVPKLNLVFMNSLILSTIETIKIQCHFDAKPQKPITKGKESDVKKVEITGLVVLKGQCVNGTVALCFPEKTFLTIMGGMLGEKFEELTKDIEDGACELMNMVFGSAKKRLAEEQHTLDRVVPSVVRGNENIAHAGHKGPQIVVPFNSDAGEFKLEFYLDSLAE